MGTIRKRGQSGLLFFDFRVNGTRYREQTNLPDTPKNRRKVEKTLRLIEADISNGTFNHRQYFPNSANSIASAPHIEDHVNEPNIAIFSDSSSYYAGTPLFSEMADAWYAELELSWRNTYRQTVRDILKIHLNPYFGTRKVASIRREELLQFRSTLAKIPGRKAGRHLSPARINTIMMILGQILNEAADRYRFNCPYTRIKPSYADFWCIG